MFDNLSDKLQRVFKNLRGEGKLSAENMESALREIRVALLEADVNFRVVKQLIENIKAKAMGEEVLMSLSPSQQVIKIVRDELIKILGSHESKLRFANEPPSVVLIVGLQGSGKTTSTGKLARWLSKNGHRPLMVSVDIYRPAAREQLRVVARDVNLPIYTGTPEETLPADLVRSARKEAVNSGRDVLLVDTAGRLHIDEDLMTRPADRIRTRAPRNSAGQRSARLQPRLDLSSNAIPAQLGKLRSPREVVRMSMALRTTGVCASASRRRRTVRVCPEPPRWT